MSISPDMDITVLVTIDDPDALGFPHFHPALYQQNHSDDPHQRVIEDEGRGLDDSITSSDKSATSLTEDTIVTPYHARMPRLQHATCSWPSCPCARLSWNNFNSSSSSSASYAPNSISFDANSMSKVKASIQPISEEGVEIDQKNVEQGNEE
ncbi:hypothetical protein C0995_010570 [Termitomyces sp. Mi166|nr:hypothetical protein C0995_010570 [Termitomyces sp. Mi166\